jgi:isopentenyl phosphate kinase
MVLDQLVIQLQSLLAPLLSLFGTVSSEKASPGDKLERRLQSMQAEISQLKASEGRSHGAGFFGNDTPGANLDARGGPQELHQLTETVATMQASLQSMRDQLASELVKVGMANFISRSFTNNWLKTEGRNAQIVFFVDAHSLLNSSMIPTTATSSPCP